jgi:hypothetical protein
VFCTLFCTGLRVINMTTPFSNKNGMSILLSKELLLQWEVSAAAPPAQIDCLLPCAQETAFAMDWAVPTNDS